LPTDCTPKNGNIDGQKKSFGKVGIYSEDMSEVYLQDQDQDQDQDLDMVFNQLQTREKRTKSFIEIKDPIKNPVKKPDKRYSSKQNSISPIWSPCFGSKPFQ
jgi:hypothetical protein